MLMGICNGYLRRPHGFAGRSLLGYQTLVAHGTPPASDADSFKTRFSPNIADGDIYIAGIGTPYRFQLRQDGTYYYNAFGDQSRQLIAMAAYSRVTSSLYAEGVFAVNDDPPRPVGGSLLNGGTYAYNQALSLQLQGRDLQNDPISFAVQSGTFPPGLSLSSAGLVSGTPNAYGSYGFTVRLSDPYGAFTDSIETVTIANVLPDFVKTSMLIAAAEAAVTALGLSFTASSVPSSLQLNTVVSQSPPPGSVITGATTVVFTYSDATLFTQPPNVFPTSIPGLTWNGTRSMLWRTNYQESLTGKVTTFGYQKYPIVEWTLTYNLLSQVGAQDDLRKIEGLFNAQKGMAGTFLYIDPTFNFVTGEPFGIGDGARKVFQLVASFGNAGAPSVAEIIQNLQPAPTIGIFDNGALVGTSSYSIGSTGIVTFNVAPAAGHTLAWTGGFYYRCRFETDDLDPEEFMYQLWNLQSLKFRSVIV